MLKLQQFTMMCQDAQSRAQVWNSTPMKNFLLLTASIVAINAAVPHLARISLRSLSKPTRRSCRSLPRSVT